MRKVAIYIDTQYNSGGTLQYTKAFIKAVDSLSSDKLSLTLLYTYKSWEEYLNSFTKPKKIFLKKSHFVNKIYKLFISFGLINILKFIVKRIDKEIRAIDKQQFDLVIFPAGDAIACLVNSNVVAAIHDLMHRYERRFKESGGFFNYRFRDNFYSNLVHSSLAVLVDSVMGEAQVRESYHRILSRIFILPYIAPDYIYKQPDYADIRSEESTKSAKYIFYPAQFWPHKNHMNLLKALKILKNREVVVDLILSGTKDREYKKLKSFVDNNNLISNVEFRGYIPDSELVAIYRKASAMVMPTYYGPTNIPPIEAILLGCPPIVSKIYGMPWQFEDSALYFDPDNPEEIADRIESLVINDEYRNRIIRNGEKIKMKFSQERFKNDLKSIFESIFEENLIIKED